MSSCITYLILCIDVQTNMAFQEKRMNCIQWKKLKKENNFEIFSFFCVVSSWASFLIAPQVKQLNSLNFIFFRFILCSDWIYTAYISLLKSTYFLSPRLFLEEWDCWSHSFSL